MPLLPLLAALALAQPPAADSVPGRGAPTFSIPRVGEIAEPAVDGRLNEAVWSQAVRLTGFHGYQPADGRPAAERTEVLLWYSPAALYVGIRAYDSEPGAVRATLADRDRIGQEDRVTLYLDTFLDRRRAFFFAVNPLGVQQDGVRSEGAASAGNTFGGSTDLNPDYAWSSAAHRTDWGWEAELRIPFTSLRYPSGDEQQWGINVTRTVQRTGHEDSWVDARRGANSFLAQSAVMTGLHGLERGLVVEAQPFVTVSATGARDPLTDRFARGSAKTSVGANARLGFAAVSIDATVNPDFSQVESDAGLVTANERFSLFVDERRPFFLEGIELFAAPNQLVYTRRIVDPIGGAKVTGKIGRWGVAYLAALDDPGGGRDNALFDILRLRRDVGHGSTVGLVATDRRDELGSNSVVAGDARIVFGGKYYLQGQLGLSHTRSEQFGPVAADTATAGIFSAEFDRTGRSWGFNYTLEGTGDDFQAAAGFVPRVGVTSGHAFNRFTWYGDAGALLERVNVFFGPSAIWRTGDLPGDHPVEGSAFVSVTPRLRGGWEIELRAATAFADFDAASYDGWTVLPASGDTPLPFVPREGLRDLPSGSIQLTTPVFRLVNATLRVASSATPIYLEAAEGREQRITLQAALRPATQLRADVAATFARLTRAHDGSAFARTVIPRLRLEYQPSRALFFRTVAEYRAERQAVLRDATSGMPILIAGVPSGLSDRNGLRLEWLASYQPTPGTVAFLGYAVDLAERDPLAFDALRARGDGFFLKLAYQLRR